MMSLPRHDFQTWGAPLLALLLLALVGGCKPADRTEPDEPAIPPVQTDSAAVEEMAPATPTADGRQTESKEFGLDDSLLARLPGGDGEEEAAKPLTTEGEPAYGEVKEGVYHNPFFGLSLSLPVDWVTSTGVELGGVAKQGADLLAGDNEGLRKRLEQNQAKSTSFPIMATSEQPLSVAQQQNRTIMLVAEKLEEPKSGQQYLIEADELLVNGVLPYSRVGDINPKNTGDTVFYMADYRVESPEARLLQTFITTIRKGYALTFIITDTQYYSLASLRGFVLNAKFTGAAEDAPDAPPAVTLAGSGIPAPALPPGLAAPDAAPDSAPAPPTASADEPVAAPAPPPIILPPPGRDRLPGADELGSTPLEIEPGE